MAQAAPTITSLSPNTGSIDGGTSVTITGTGFTGATGVTFGGMAGSNLAVVSDTKINVVTPAHAAGAADVVVTTASGDSSAATYTYEVSAPGIATQPSGTSIGVSGTATFSVVATGAGPFTYQWQVSVNGGGGWSTVPEDAVGAGTTTDTLRITPSAVPGMDFDGFQFRVVVTGANGSVTSNAATLSVTGAVSTDAKLSNLVLSAGTLNPAFTSGTNGYAVTVPDATNSITVTPTASGANATITVNGSAVTSGSASGAISLVAGANIISITVTAQDGIATQSYIVTVTREAPASADATLSGLTLSAGTLLPGFTPATTDYNAGVPFTTNSITVTPTTNDSNATVTVNNTPVASGAASGAINLSGFGSTAITIKVTAQNGTTAKIYTVNVSRLMPFILSVTPNTGSLAGGTSVVLAGLNFTGATGVSFGDVEGTGFQLNSDTQATVTTPPGTAAGAVDVKLLFAGGAFTQKSGGFTYQAASSTLTLSPADGTALSGGTVGAAYAQTFTASGGTGPYTYAITGGALPAGLTLAADGNLSGTPTATTDASFTVTVTDSSSPANTGTASYTLKIVAGIPGAPTITSITPPEKGILDSMVYATIKGTGLSTTQSVVFGVVHASQITIVSDTEISLLTPHNLPGVYNVTVNTNGGSVTATNAFKVTLPPTSVVLSASSSTPALGETVTLTATFTSHSLPTGIVTFKDGGTVLGTDTLTGSGNTATFSTSTLGAGVHSITAEYAGDGGNAPATSAAITVTVGTGGGSDILVLSPASGSALKDAMAGEDYSQPISATGGTAPLTYSLASGTLPDGIVLNVSTGELTGPLSAAAEVKNYSFAIKATGAGNATGTANYTLRVTERAVTVTSKSLDVPAGSTPTNVNLEDGATGGPFSSAETTFVEPSNAGTASIVRGEFAAVGPTPLGWYLKFIPNPAYSGTVKVGFKLTSTLGTSNTGIVTYALGYDPAKVAANIDNLVHGFVQTRQNMIANTLKVPGLLERRQMENATDPVTAGMTPSATGITASFSTSLAQLESARDSADGMSGGYASPFNIWIDGTFMMHNRDENDSRWGSFGIINLGADYLLTDKALFGLSFHYDRMTDPTRDDAELTGNGWLAGPYASLEIGKSLFWDTSLLYGGSANDIDTLSWDGSFDTTRWLIDTSIKGEWKLDEETTLTPKLRVLYFSETIKDYSVANTTGSEIGIEGFNEEQFRVSLGAEIARSFTLKNDMKLTPKLGVNGGFSGLDGSGAFGSVSAGLTLQTQNAWAIDTGLLFNIEGDGQVSVGAKAGVSSRF